MPEGIDGLVWRVALHPRNRASLDEIETRWSFESLMDAHAVLDAVDDAERRAHADAAARN